MGIDNIIKMAVVLVLAAAATGHLPEITMAVRRAQVDLLQESRASRWGSPDILYTHSKIFKPSPILTKAK